MNTHFAAQCRIDTPLGPMTLAATERGLAGAWFDAQAHHPGLLQVPTLPQYDWLALGTQELTRYFDGRLTAFSVPLDPQGTAFQQAVWRALLQIGRGQLGTYGDIARALGKPEAARAVGAAVGRNPISVVVPCHRVVGRDGSLTGYAGGLPRKQALLTLEGAARATQAAA